MATNPRIGSSGRRQVGRSGRENISRSTSTGRKKVAERKKGNFVKDIDGGGMDSYCFDPNRVIGRKENRRDEQMDLLSQEIDKRGYPFARIRKRVGKARFQVN